MPRTQTSLSLDENVRAKEGGKETTGETSLRLPFVPFPWSLAVHYQSLAITLRKTKRLRRRRLREEGGGGGWNPSPRFLACCSISKRFYLQWKAFDLLNKMRYILWVVALLGAVTSSTTVAILAAILDFAKN